VAEIFFFNFEAKIGALVALYVWTLGLKGFFDKMMFTTLKREHPALQNNNIKILYFFYFCGQFLPS
jgi:hypothetical protein